MEVSCSGAVWAECKTVAAVVAARIGRGGTACSPIVRASVVQVQLLGGVAATTSVGDPVDVGPPKCRALLAALALSVGEAVPVARLVDLVWDQQPPATAAKILQGYVGRLRKSLGADAIERVGAAYRLTIPADAVDAARFQRLARSNDVGGALATWTGAPLAGLDAPGLAAAVDGLVEQWLVVVEHDLERRIATDAAASVAPLTELTAAHPFREGLWALLMTALWRTGRQGDALATYRRARDQLVEQLGVEPGPRLQALETRILAADDPPAGGAVQSDVLPGGARPPGPAPTPLTGTVTFGAAEVADATRLWSEHRRKMALAVARLETVAREITARHGGTVIHATGETVVVGFHHPHAAAGWARELHLTTEQEPWPGGVDVRLRVGLHSGEVGERNGSHGAARHLATRLAAAGNGRQTLVSGSTASLLGRDDLTDLGSHRLDGVGTDLDVFQLGPEDHPPLRTAAARRGNLPRRIGSIMGRDGDVEVVGDALDAAPVVTLVGPGGIGKTTLALAAARQWADDRRGRVWVVELAEVAEPADVLPAVGETIGVTEGPAGSLDESIVASLRARPTLLVLDNCEHVVVPAAALAQHVADHAPQTRVLATSREGLAVRGEQVVPVGALDPAGAAAELFATRARAVAGAVDLDRDRAEVEEICRRLDGVPLAIELAAARTRSLTPSQLLERLAHRLRFLVGGDRSAPDRHRTLHAAVQWSYDLLSPAQRQLFHRLAVFRGTFDLEAAEAVAVDADLDAVEVDRLLGDLVERSMVAVEAGPLGRRFRMLETLRTFADERLAARGDREDVEHRHGRWCQAQVERIHGLLTGSGEVEGVARLGELSPNLRVAVERACACGDQDLAAALVRPIVTEVNLRRQAEIGVWAERILALTPPADEGEVVFWLTWALHPRMQTGDRAAYDRLVRRHGHADHPLVRYTHGYLYEDGEELCAASPAAVRWLEQRGEHHAARLVEQAGVASGLMTTGRFAELDALVGGMTRRYRAKGPPTLLYFALGFLGYSAQLQGRDEAAGRWFLEAASVEVPAGTYAVSRPAEARAMFERGDRLRAFRLLADHVDDLLATDYTDVARLVAVEFVNLMAAIDRLPEAARALAYLDTVGDFGALARNTLVADAARRIEGRPDLAGGVQTDAPRALSFMRDVLDALAAQPLAGSRPG